MNNQVFVDPTEIAAQIVALASDFEADTMMDNIETYGLDTEEKMTLWMSKYGAGVSQTALEAAAASTLLTIADDNGGHNETQID